MKDYILLNYDYIFNDHMAKCSHKAKLYYIKLMFFANNGFVANSKEVLDSLGYDRGVLDELIANDEILTLPGRDEVFITAYFLHTRFNPASWLQSPFAIYWRGKLRTKKNGVATFNPNPEPTPDPLDKIVQPEEKEEGRIDWDKVLDDLNQN